MNWLVFITEMKRVYSAVRTGSLNKAYWSRDAPTVWHSTTLRSADTAFMCFVFMWEQTATCTTYSINWLVFINEMKSVYSAVRTGSLNKAYRSRGAPPVSHSTTVRSAHTVFMCFVFIWVQTTTCATYSINWLVFITEMKSVYSVVRTGSLNKAYWSRDAPPV